ncbi:hypothetical protein [Cellulosilyticum ruminicola]|uniref:hypothetical protein n=1 Tax=Cellulosilyticum ruminicola TaxID=425254 RepID=UPI0006D2BD95|nr:hypothetical protein [Cellulosilyticum ruminicola]
MLNEAKESAKEVTKEIDITEMKNFLLKQIDEIAQTKVLVRAKELGASNIRNMANIAQNSDCYEEFKLFMAYKKVKGQGKGWGTPLPNTQGKETLADKVIEHLDQINERCSNDKETLKWVSQYFGYLYWKRVAVTVNLSEKQL